MPIELVLAALTLVTIAFIYVLGAPPVSSTRKESAAVISLLQPEAPREITDLGAGWGALVSRLARAFADANVVGYELSPLPFLIASLRCLPVKNARIRFGDFRKAPLKGALVCYLARAPMHTVATLPPPNSVLVSICFLLRDRTPERIVKATGLGGDVALYRF